MAAPKKPKPLTPEQKKEQATMKWVAEKYGMAYSLLTANPDLMKLFKTAVKEKWAEDTTGNAQAKFMQQLRQTKWWTTQSDEWRKDIVLKATDPQTWKLKQAERLHKFNTEAAKVGAGNYSDHMRNTIIHEAVSGGWDAERLDQELAKNIKRDALGRLTGQAGTLEQQLKQVAEDNGVQFGLKFYGDAARSVGQGQKTADDWATWIRDQAANQYSAYADQIRGGTNLKDLAIGVVGAIANELEEDPARMGLHDPLVQKALTNVDEHGKPRPMALWEVKQMARDDPRFMKTQAAQSDLAGIGADLLKSWGAWQ